MSKFGSEIDSILVKNGRDWTNEESKKIQFLMKNGHKQELNSTRQELRQNINNQKVVS